jgi:hypothetical protein
VNHRGARKESFACGIEISLLLKMRKVQKLSSVGTYLRYFAGMATLIVRWHRHSASGRPQSSKRNQQKISRRPLRDSSLHDFLLAHGEVFRIGPVRHSLVTPGLVVPASLRLAIP